MASLGPTLLFLLAPLVELWVFHEVAARRFGPNLTVIGINARDVLLPLFLGSFLFFHRLRLSENLRPRLSRWLALNAALFVGTLFVLEQQPPADPHGYVLGLFLLVGGSLLSSLFVAYTPRSLGRALTADRRRAALAAAALGVLVPYPYVLDRLWAPLSTATAACVSAVLALFGLEPAVVTGGSLAFRHAGFSVTIATGCSGLEGIFFLLFLFCLVKAFETKTWGTARESMWIAGGLLWLFALNVVRLSVLFTVGYHLSVSQGRQSGNSAFAWAAHNQAGWLLYLVGILAFFQLRHRRLSKAEAQGRCRPLPKIPTRNPKTAEN